MFSYYLLYYILGYVVSLYTFYKIGGDLTCEDLAIAVFAAFIWPFVLMNLIQYLDLDKIVIIKKKQKHETD